MTWLITSCYLNTKTMKRAAAPVWFVIALSFGASICAKNGLAMSAQDSSREYDAAANARHEGAHEWHGEYHPDFNQMKLGTIQVGPSASGEALRILSTAFRLRELGHRCKDCLGIVVGPRDLFRQSTIAELKAAYVAGQGVALAKPTPASIQRLHDLLGHRGSAQPASSATGADLVAFRQSLRADGQRHSSSHVLLARKSVSIASGASPHKNKDRQQGMADANDIKALQRVFSATPIVPTTTPGDAPQNLVNLAESYESHGIQSDAYGNQVQVINSVWAARSFLNSADFYYVNQEVDYSVNTGAGKLTSWTNYAGANTPYSNVTLLQPSPQSTLEAVQVTSGVSSSIGVSVGFSTGQGLNASVTATTTIAHSNTTTVPAMTITNGADFSDADTNWTYVINDLGAAGSLDLYNNWIWQVPFASYNGAAQGELVVNYSASLETHNTDTGLEAVDLTFSASVPWPFGETFQIQPPVVAGISPSCVDSGQPFTVQGTGLYPSLVQAVLVNGTPVAPSAVTTASDTQLNVIAPDTVQCHFGCPVAIQTNEGTSNTNFEVEISSFCGTALGRRR